MSEELPADDSRICNRKAVRVLFHRDVAMLSARLKQPMKVYLAGRIQREPNYHAIFAKGADRLRVRGHSVFNPAAANLEGMPLARIMAHVLTQLCECEAIALLPGWWRSGGARIEFLLAKYLGLKVIWL